MQTNVRFFGGSSLTKNPIDKGNNIRKIVTVSLIVILLMLCTGISFAVWNYSFLGETNTLETGEVSLELLESNTNLINLTNQLPMSDSEGKTLETFDFTVITKASRDMELEYEIKIEKLSTDTGYTSLNDNEVKVYLTDYDNNQLVSPVKISDLSNYSLYSKVNTHSKTITEIKDKYKLRVWIDSEVDASKFYDENTDSVRTYQYKFKIGVTGGEFTVSIPAVTMLTAKVGESGLEEVIHPADSTLQIGATEDITEFRFRGGDTTVTNNYVYFNCTDINNQSADTCELYRIIGLFPTDDGTGRIENRIKLIKAENYGNNFWNENGTNNWAEPATLNTEFNTTYWGTINEKYQALVGNAKYYLGGYTTTDVKTSAMYEYERKSEGTDYYYSGNPTNWTGKLALMYASDYGYGANSTCSESTTLYNYETNSCPDNNWLYLTTNEWLLPQNSSNSYIAFDVSSNGFVSSSFVVNNLSSAVRPVFYLKSDAKFNDKGDGSQENPYQLMER
ncbi:MAG: hypothetical protein ACI31R_04840 [Bacilli bacterium]